MKNNSKNPLFHSVSTESTNKFRSIMNSPNFGNQQILLQSCCFYDSEGSQTPNTSNTKHFKIKSKIKSGSPKISYSNGNIESFKKMHFLTDKNEEINSRITTNSNNQYTMNMKSNNLEQNSNLNINNLNTFNNNINTETEQNFGINSQRSNKNMGNYLQNSLSSNTSGMIMPETNFTGYKFNEKIGNNLSNKYMNNTGLGFGVGGSLLAHKYGGSATNSMSIHVENNMNENFGNSASKINDLNNNLEEEYPRTLAQPQSQIIRK